MDKNPIPHRRGGASHPPTLLLAALLVQVAASWAPSPLPDLPGLLRAAGVCVLALGVGLNVAAARGFERAATPVRPLSPPRALVTGGVYRVSRNPMYLGLALVLVGAALVLSSPWAALVVPAFVAVVARLVRHEEALMEEAFGDAYRAYRLRVRRWL